MQAVIQLVEMIRGFLYFVCIFFFSLVVLSVVYFDYNGDRFTEALNRAPGNVGLQLDYLEYLTDGGFVEASESYLLLVDSQISSVKISDEQKARLAGLREQISMQRRAYYSTITKRSWLDKELQGKGTYRDGWYEYSKLAYMTMESDEAGKALDRVYEIDPNFEP